MIISGLQNLGMLTAPRPRLMSVSSSSREPLHQDVTGIASKVCLQASRPGGNLSKAQSHLGRSSRHLVPNEIIKRNVAGGRLRRTSEAREPKLVLQPQLLKFVCRF